MASKLAKEEEGSSKTKKRLDDWKEFLLPIHEASTSKHEPTTQDGNTLRTPPDNSIFQKGTSMATNEEERRSSKIKTKLEKWKYPKIPVNQVYKTKIYNNQRKAAKDFEQTITLRGDEQNVSVNLLKDLISKKEFEHVHLGLVQVAIKPLMNDGLKDAVIVCLRDERFLTFEKSLLAVVESNLSQGPFYFNCFPGYPISSRNCDAFTLSVVTNGVP
ncbi:hypothetical protein SOVF_075830 [Spinacia oleracea]|uniref:Uncharacterized protein isoform X1 n=1 Tax=Spinacia oleracea TaxID=3562 RepID=A0A9R0IPD9_SPIOL|nr:uncharacterized protein LOC110791698 isoform X1 [Spinacia oleracea]KNA17890.1 hypothetical protein SOVF_075830 [Spinacia oleracea]